MRTLLTTALLLGTALSPSGDAAPPVEQVIDQEMTASGVPGLAFAIVEGDTVTTGARGVREAGTDLAVTPDTPFLIGSISKSFTALAVMQLVEAGLVDLDDPISAHLDEFVGGPAAAITVRQLLSHTSGYSTLQGNSSPVGPTDSPANPTGATWEYSNTNYQILGRLVEAKSGHDFETYVEERILDPVGMDSSFVSDGAAHEEMAVGHTPWFWTKRPLDDRSTSRESAPQGGVVASASDLARYLTMMMNGDDDILSAEGKATMMKPAGAASPFYGLGWFIDAPNGTVWHSGSTPGVETLAVLSPDEERAALVLVNGGSGMGFGETTRLRDRVIAAALGMPGPEAESRWEQQALFVGLTLLPVAYGASIVWAWRHRSALRAKRGGFGLFSLWFPLATTITAAAVLVWVMPRLLGSPIGTILRFQPDVGIVLVASAVMGMVWATFRLGVAYSGRANGKDPAAPMARKTAKPVDV